MNGIKCSNFTLCLWSFSFAEVDTAAINPFSRLGELTMEDLLGGGLGVI